MKIKDTFEIKAKHKTGHEPGLVVVLDTPIVEDPGKLVGQIACIWLPSGNTLELPIDEAKEHGAANSLFFRGLAPDDIPVGCEIKVAQQPSHTVKKPSPSIASKRT